MSVAKFTLDYDPRKTTKAWLIKLPAEEKEHWVPYSCIKEYLPATRSIKIQTWILKQKNIKFKLDGK